MRRSDEETERKRARESRVVHEMIALYCRGIHHTAKGSLCPECEALDAYAQKRIARCPFMRTKTFCSMCSVHCYAPKRQEEIRQVMRYADPRILFRHPVMCLHHALLYRRWDCLGVHGRRGHLCPHGSGARRGDSGLSSCHGCAPSLDFGRLPPRHGGGVCAHRALGKDGLRRRRYPSRREALWWNAFLCYRRGQVPA